MNTSEVISHISNWLLDYCKTTHAKGFAVGVSGGIDSAVTSTLAAKTGLPTLCLEMPIHQAATQDSRAKAHINQLKSRFNNLSSVRVDLTPVFDTFVRTVPDTTQDRFLALANTRARLRMSTLYYFSSLHNYLVVGTGNKVEDFGVGFFTKYGDGGVDLSPIADLMKSQVYAVADELNVIEEIMQAQPTDGLWGDNRTDEDQLGASYAELEWAMNNYSKRENAIFSDRQQQVMALYIKLNHTNQHKMQAIPVCTIPKEFLL